MLPSPALLLPTSCTADRLCQQRHHSCAAQEVVEARHGGMAFQICRKRKSAAAPPARPVPSTTAARSARSRRHMPPRQRCRQSPYADELEVPFALGPRPLVGLAALPDRAAAADRLLAICQGLSDAAAMEAAPTPRRAVALSAALADFQAALAGALSSGGVALGGAPRPPPTPTDDGEVEQPDYRVDLAARKSGLRARLANFQKARPAWEGVLRRRRRGHVAQCSMLHAAACSRQPALDGKPAPAPLLCLQEEADWHASWTSSALRPMGRWCCLRRT